MIFRDTCMIVYLAAYYSHAGMLVHRVPSDKHGVHSNTQSDNVETDPWRIYSDSIRHRAIIRLSSMS